MRKLYILTLALCFASVARSQNVNVNPGAGSYPTLQAAFAAINAGTHTGAITVDVVASTTETGVCLLNASGSGSASYTSILIQPSGGAARTVSGAIVAGSPLIDLSGADNVTFDGLNSGGNSLIIENTTVSATLGTATIRFIDGATSNTITNCFLKGAGTMNVATDGAVVFFSTDAVTANGNDNNTISNCDIGPSGANLPTKAILGNGSTTTTAIGNSGITINNNDIHDYFGAAVTSAGIATNGGCNTWSITNNRFYQTDTRTWTTGAQHNAINIGNNSVTSGAQGFTITGNIVGYASNTQTGTYTLTGSTGKFIGIQFNGITLGTVSNINNNTVASVSLTGVTSSGVSAFSPMVGILINNGVAATNNNTIGSQSATGSLTFSTNSTTATDAIGIYNFSVDITNAANNTIGGISVTNAGASGTFIIYGIRINTGSAVAATLTSNVVGGTVANSIELNATGTSSQVIGIQTSNAPAVFTSNTVRNLTNNIGIGTGTSASVIGINVTTTTPNHTLSQNTIHTLTNTNTSGASIVTGIQFTGSTANVVERNLIYNLLAPTTSTTAEINGIRVAGGTTTYRNNMIALGANQAIAIGTTATNSSTAGINGFNGALGTDAFIHNSVYIGGTATSGAGNSYALNGTQTTNTRSFRDNIFFNARSNSGATGKHYAVKINGTAPNPTGLTINNNLYFANGTGAVFGFYNSSDVADIAAWKTAVGQDGASFESNPQFNDPTNSTPDLHLHPTNSTVAEANGADVGVVNDFDGQTRASLTPVDIGADAGNFTGTDLSAPVITYTALANTNLNTNRTIAVTITDLSGVATGGLSPRIYFAKNAGAYFSTQAILASGTVNNGVWTCTIDYALVGGVVTTDVIRYFVVAQDVAGNLAANPGSGITGTNVNTVTTPPTTPNSYLISAAISGIKTVCASGCDYTTLTGASGAFNAINSSAVTGNIELQIAGDLTVGEDGTNGLNILAEQPATSNFTLKIYPTGAARAITGSANTTLIRMNGASRVTIDGSIGGTGTDRSLTITNTSVTTPSVVLFGSVGTTPITNGTLKNCVIINGINTSSAVIISDASSVGNAGYFSNITVQNNDVQKAFVGVFAQGGTTPQNGSNLTYSGNTINTAGANAVRSVGLYMQGVNGATVSNNTIGNIDKTNNENDAGIWLASGTINATVSGNTVATLGYTGTAAFAPVGIYITSGVAATNNNITGNSVSDISTNGGTQVRGISVTGATADLIIQKNNVQGIINSNTGTFGAYGIDISGGNNIVVKNNFVSNLNLDMTGGAAFSTQFGVFGIRVGSGTGHKIYHNSVNLYGALAGTATTSLLSAAFCLVSTASTGCDVRNNIFANNITGGTTSIAHVSVYLPSGGSSAMNLTWNNNLYYFGTDAARQGVGQAGTTAGTNFFTTLPALAAYSGTLSPAATNDNASQAFTTAVPYVSGTDLHLSTSNDLGTPLASVTDDFDNGIRSATTPDIGADEIINTVCTLSLTSAVGTNAQTVCLNTAITNITYSNTASLGATDATFGGLPTGVTGSWSGDAVTISGSPSVGGTFNYTVTLVGGICAGVTANGTITVNANPTVSINPASSSLCIGQTLNLTATAGLSTYSWSSSGTFTSTTNQATLSNPASGGYSFTVTATNANNCTATATASVTVNDLPTVVISSASQVCVGANLNLSVTGGLSNYSWSNPGGVFSSTTNEATFSSTSSGGFSFTVTAGNGSCTNTATASVTVNALPTASISLSNTAVCAGQSISLTATAGLSTYSWSSSGTFTSTTNQATLSNPASGGYSFTVTVTNANNCTATATASVTVNALPTLSISPSISQICAGQNLTLNASSGLSAYSWSKSSGNFTGSTNQPQITFNGAVGGYTLTVTASNGTCSNSATASVSVAAIPGIIIQASNPQPCVGEVITLSATAGMISYSWNKSGGSFTGSTNQPQISYSNSIAGNYTISVTGVNGASCSATGSISIQVKVKPTASISPSTTQSICVGQALSLTASGASPYSWSGPGNFNSTNAIASLNTSNTSNSGIYQVMVGTGVCTATATVSVQINANPIPNPSSNSSICTGETLRLSSNGGGSSYSWAANGYASSEQNPTRSSATTAMAGVYSITVTNSSGCTTSASINVLVYEAPNLMASSNSSLCEGKSLQLSASGGTNYSWEASGFSSSQQNPSRSNASPSMSGIYKVTALNGSCSITSTATISVQVNPSFTVSIAFGAICLQGNPLNLSASGGDKYRWRGPNGFSSTSATPTKDKTVATDEGVYSVTVTGNGVCTVTSTIQVYYGIGSGGITIANRSPYCKGGPITLTATAAGGSTYSWTKQFGSVTFTGNPVTITNSAKTSDGGVYIVFVTGQNGCIEKQETLVTVSPVACIGTRLATEEAEDIDMEINAYPNPVTNTLRVEVTLQKPSKLRLSLVNSIGKESGTWQLNEESTFHKTELNMSELTGGVYLLQAQAGKQKVVKRVVKIQY